jgi:acylphosphatase
LPSGEVEAVFEGDPDAVDSLVDFCQRGPRGAQVTAVEVEDAPLAGRQGFQVR